MPRSRLPFAIAALTLVVVVGGYVIYDQVLSGDNVAPLALPTTSPAPAATNPAVTDPAGTDVADPAATANAGASAEPTATTDPGASTPSAAAGAKVAGTWTVASGSQAGYRVRERLATLSAESDAVGRTTNITGSITIESDGATTALTAGTMIVDTTTIASDEGRRDNRMRSEGLQTDSFPTASFTITRSVEIPEAALAGTASDLTLEGDLTLHGVTRTVSIPAQARLLNGTIEVAGSISFPLAHFDIVTPNVGGFIISIADDGVLEFQVNFTKG